MSSVKPSLFPSSPPRKPRADGERSRQAILLAAARLATTRGLASMSIGDLAEHIGMSKSGLYAHFRSKEEIELATIDTAVEIFTADVLEPTRDAKPGRARLVALTEAFLSHLTRRVFPGGCFFAAAGAELDTRPGRARDRVIAFRLEWDSQLSLAVREAQVAGEIARRDPIEQIVFEVNAMLLQA